MHRKEVTAMNKTCKDCIHYEPCDFPITELTKMTVRECPHGFKDKSRYIELPCAVGDVVYIYYDTTNSIERFRIENIVIGESFDQLKLDGGSVFTIWDKDYDKYFGKFIFLTKEEAEKVLKGGAE